MGLSPLSFYKSINMPVCLIGLGSNQGDRLSALDAAIAELHRRPQIHIGAVSAWRETAPIGGPPDQPPYLNGAIRIETSLAPHELLECLMQIENRLGRRRPERWAARTIDLDLLLYDELVIDTPELIVPHPRMAHRRFVLEPAAEVAGWMPHPTIRWTIARLLEHLNTTRPYLAITGAIAAGKTELARRLAETIPAQLILEQPDWPRLDAFYTDPVHRGWQMELEFLDHRAQLLAADLFPGSCATGSASTQSATGSASASSYSDKIPHDCNGGAWLISDFWFDQSAAFARAWLAEEQLPEYIERFDRLRRQVLPPKLIVLLDLPADELLIRVGRRGRECERRLTHEQLDRIRRAVRDEAQRPGLGPVLHPACNDPEGVYAEVLAAMQAME
jgi:2-amino-4-hydroxy-6-hydroxymethyldihydropteridine diphosphokinase